MRRRLRMSWFSLPLFVVVTICGTFLLKRHQRVYHYSPTTAATIVGPSFSLGPLKHVTKSLAELGPMDDLNPYVLFFNRIPKCGSEILVLLIQWLQGWNNFRHVRLKDNNHNKQLSRIEQEELVYEVTDVMKKRAVPLTFDKHLYFLNFSSFDRQSPTYINLIRDPVDKLLSRYYYARVSKTESAKVLEECVKRKLPECTFKSGKPYDMSIPYFCGQDPRCTLLNDEWALRTAKVNVERYYPVVGVLEELNATLEVFEHKLPYFFKGVHKLYYRDLLKSHRNRIRRKTKINPTIRKYFRSALLTEYEFYDWIKRRLFNQLQVLQ